MADETKVEKPVAGAETQPRDEGRAEPVPAEGAAEAGGEAKPAARSRARGSRHVPTGIVHIKSTFNNTMVSITDPHGSVVSWSSSGRAGFKGSRKSTAYAASVVGQEAARAAMSYGMREVEIHVQGAGAGRESAIRAIQTAGLSVSVIRDVTPVPHNGCRPRKRRRV